MRIAIATLAAGAAFLFVAGGAFVFSGAYNVAASEPHSALVWWLLDTVKRHSVRRRARNVRLIQNPDDAASAHRGAGAYRESCAPCHGPPGEALGSLGEGLNPQPPNLRRSSRVWSAPELFWIVKHGIKSTGMPAWDWQYRDDEIWSLVALMRRFPSMTAAEYRELTSPKTAEDVGTGIAALATQSCAVCHGTLGQGRGEVPRLAGQKRDYIASSLRRYASGERRSGIMAATARALSEAQIEALANYFAGLYAAPLEHVPGAAEAVRLQRGGVIAAQGAPGVQACSACHDGSSAEADPLVPRLAGQTSAYLALQLDLWRTGERTESPMREIAAKLDAAQIEALAAYYARLP